MDILREDLSKQIAADYTGTTTEKALDALRQQDRRVNQHMVDAIHFKM